MSPRVYVASVWEDFPRARKAMAALRARGCVITHDWAALADEYPNDDAPKPLAREHARQDLDGVASADYVLVLTPTDKTRGCGLWIEMGAALAGEKVLVISGAQRERSIFCQLAALRVERDEDAVTWIAGTF